MSLLREYYSLFINGIWIVITLIGYFFWSWDIGQTILFLNVSFFSLFLNHYFSLCELTYKNTVIASIKGTLKHEDLSQPLVIIWQIFVFVFNLFLFTFALAISLIITGAIAGSFFYKALKVNDFSQFLEKWDGQWSNVILVSGIILVFEFLGFRRDLKKLNVHEMKDWNIFLPMIKNTKFKFNAYFWGSIVAIIIDSLVSDFKTFGYVCLLWMFICNFIWSYIDVRFKSVPLPIEAYHEEEE
ncbi:hypothetical protein [Fluviicola taffensis]|uniref:Uncharacterized protein n=1 Tax=Fluviicola taffensis (strain DSM 16823 / NCIMB 13979 / RW262) TaxID=755732 RepID=F2I9E9_FLUTR|nr:hypothetical protein [Fluviicola taffensis]AEA44106.1 hypothetical protein Fluta_2120 [Fluviicola taffensis DSM 16823]